MSALNPTAGKAIRGHLPAVPSLHSHCRFLSAPLNFRNPAPVLPLLSFTRTRASSSPPPPSFGISKPKSSNHPSQFFDSSIFRLNSVNLGNCLLSLLRTGIVTSITAAVLFISGFCFTLRPTVALAVSPPPTVEKVKTDEAPEGETEKSAASEEEREKSLEYELVVNPNDVKVLRELMEVKIKSKKVGEAIALLDKLIELDPKESEWTLLKAHLHAYNGEMELARKGFYELLKTNPFHVEAYHGLVTAAAQEDSSEELEKIGEMVKETVELCKKENKKNDYRNFKLLFAQIQVIEGNFDKAMKLYDELEKEEPRDFRPYLCQGIIYTLLEKKAEAEKCFEKYRKLVPKEHPFAKFFDGNMLATKIFAQKAQNERAQNERAARNS